MQISKRVKLYLEHTVQGRGYHKIIFKLKDLMGKNTNFY